MTDKPQPYKFCEAHFKANCPICSTAQPNPVVNEASPVAAPQTGKEEVSHSPAPPPAPVLTSPKAQKIVEAARKYAEVVEAAAIIEDQVAQTEELLAALKKKLSETKQSVEEALKETKNL